MSIWIVIFAVGFVVTTWLALRRRDRGAHIGCHGGAAWPPDDVTQRDRAAQDGVPAAPPIQPAVAAAVRERELVGAGAGSASHNGHGAGA